VADKRRGAIGVELAALVFGYANFGRGVICIECSDAAVGYS
jgi:hypothetical protein